ncbi:aspartate/glutamate racemase family protein [Jannaschia sp. LMIT008]|uniref:maleate cis-trans isomerase family protein n=1 Tax=Jannaschia maritima TaxID=3032585 RepID=UPI0028115F32|nr:aspartate/glutamate racemase family protein [Jannaschia sp. LMIT008]
MLVPSSNTALEPLTAVLAAPLAREVGIHFSRFRVTRIGLDADADAQFSTEPILAAAELLADARASVIAWNGTAASWRGFDTDAALCAAIEARTGCRATSAIVDLNAALARLGIRRLGLVTPYTQDVEAAIVANYARAGIEITASRRADRSDNYSFADIPPAAVHAMCRDVAATGVDAIAIVCTNMRGPGIVTAIEAEFGIPVLDSIAVTLWGSLRALDIDTAPLSRFGRLFALPAP